MKTYRGKFVDGGAGGQVIMVDKEAKILRKRLEKGQKIEFKEVKILLKALGALAGAPEILAEARKKNILWATALASFKKAISGRADKKGEEVIMKEKEFFFGFANCPFCGFPNLKNFENGEIVECLICRRKFRVEFTEER